MTNIIRSFLLLAFMQAAIVAIAENERPVLTLKMRNGDIITGIADISSITFRTPYGDLAFPIRDVAGVTLGINTSGIEKSHVTGYLDQIQSGAGPEATAAFEKLIKMEPAALPYIRDYMEAPSYRKKEGGEVSIELAYEVLLSRHHLNKSFHTKDVLQTNGATSIEGSYEFESLTLETDYGRISVNRSKINAISVVYKEVSNTNSGTFKLNASQNIAGNPNGGWLNTGILVHKDQVIQISATGQVNIASLSNNAYTPDGGVNGSAGPRTGEPTYGSVVYKIGEAGQVMKAGDNMTGRSAAIGIIYISIFESVYNAANTGSYTVKVAVN